MVLLLTGYKTPLAYFAKGPLSRARAAFNDNAGSVYDRSLLTQFLRSIILPLITIDAKYRETLPDLVKGFPFETLSDNECASLVTAIGKKTRKSKKTKAGKNGLYADEEMSIARWWTGKDMSYVVCDSSDAREDAIKRALLELRARETQLQIILILETLALEASVTMSSGPDSLQEALPIQGGVSQKRPKKPKKPQDLDTLLDLLADRLCIWQSMAMDEAKSSKVESKTSSEHENKRPNGVAQNGHLRQFCVDVVLPL